MTDGQSQCPTVSVIMPAWNAESTIRQAIESVAGQVGTDLNLIIVDDASSDETAEVARSYTAGRLQLFRSDVNHGPGPSRDLGIGHARSPWISLIDADDTWRPERLKSLLDAASESGADVVFDDTMLCHDTERGLQPWKSLHGTNAFGGRGDQPREVKIEDYITSERLLIHPIIRTRFIREHNIRHSTRRFAEDAEFYLRLALAGAKFCYVPRPLYNYRISPGSLTAQAKDPTLMRRCLEECAQWPGWPPSTQDAFRRKVAKLRQNESLYDLKHLVRTWRFVDAARLIASNPQLLSLLPRKLSHQLRYHAHRTLHRGRAR